MSGNENITSDVTVNKESFFKKLANGNFGLAKTFWQYGVLVRIIVTIILKAITLNKLLLIVLLTYTVYETILIIGTWRAANKYKGLKLWAILAKLSVILGIIILLIFLISLFGLLV